MNPISLYVAVGAISLAKCRPSIDLLEPSRRRYFDEFSEDYWNNHNVEEHKSKGNNSENNEKFGAIAENSRWNEATEPISFDERTSDENKGSKSEIFPDWLRLFIKIFHRCKATASRMLPAVIKANSNSPSEFKENFFDLVKSIKISSFRCLNEILEHNLNPLTNCAHSLKNGFNLTGGFSIPCSQVEKPLGQDIQGNPRQTFREFVKGILSKGWGSLIYDKLTNLLRGYSLEFQVEKSSTVEGRGRRRDHRMFAMMVMGFMIMASILIPMGFQFLTVLGGKSLLLAKMALIMSAINGLKKIATSNVGYGFYHTGSDGHHHDHVHHGFHEKLFHANPQNSAPQYGFNK